MRNATLMLAATLVFAATTIPAQESEHKHPPESQTQVSMGVQLAELQAKVARLETALEQQHRGKKPQSSHSKPSMGGMGKGMGMGMGMGMMKKKPAGTGQGMDMGGSSGMSMGGKGMGMMKKKGSSAKGMNMGSSSGMSMGGKGMRMMGKMSAPAAAQPSSLPGFPGISHLYHIGASGFFLDHAEHLDLSSAQRRSLGSLQEKTTLGQATLDRGLAQAEQDLWVLTSSDSPDAKSIEAKLRQIVELQVKKRMSFIRAIGEAAKQLTDSQRKILLGESSTAKPEIPSEHSDHDLERNAP